VPSSGSCYRVGCIVGCETAGDSEASWTKHRFYGALGELSSEMIVAGYRPVSAMAHRLLEGPNVLDALRALRPTILSRLFPGPRAWIWIIQGTTEFACRFQVPARMWYSALTALWDWYRVLKTRGYLNVLVPHQHLHERKAAPPSRSDQWLAPAPVARCQPRFRLLRTARAACARSFRDRIDRGEVSSAPRYADDLVEKPIARLAVEHFASLTGFESELPVHPGLPKLRR